MTRRRAPSSREAVSLAFDLLASERVLGVIAQALRTKGEPVDFQPPAAPGVADPQGSGHLAYAEMTAGVGAAVTASALLGHDALPSGPLLTDFEPHHGDWRLPLLHALLYGGLAATVDGAWRLNPRQHRRIRQLVQRQDAVANHWLGGYELLRLPTLNELADARVPTLLQVAMAALEWHHEAAGKLAEAADEPETADIHRLAMDVALEALSGPSIERGLSAS